MSIRRLLLGVVLSLSACTEGSPVSQEDPPEEADDETPPAVDARPAKGGSGGSISSGGTGGSSGSGGSPTGMDAAAGLPDASAPAATPLDGGADASASDAGAMNPTAPGLGQPPSCASAPAVLCEDFEKAEVGGVPAGWTREGNVQTAADQPARGQRTLRARTPQRVTYSNNRITKRQTIPGTHWGRVYYRVALPAPRPPSGVIHATFVAFTGTMPNGGAAEFRVVDTVLNSFNNKHSYIYNVQPTASREFGRSTSNNWSFDGEWKCVEWFIDEANQAFQLYLNGGQAPALSFSNGAGNYDRSQIPKTFSSVKLGVTHYQNSQTGYVVSVDELVIDSKRVGCQ